MSETVSEMLALPGGEDSGRTATWRLPTLVTDDVDVVDGLLVITARFLGLGSSRYHVHGSHVGEFPTRDERCGYCRWYEMRLFRVRQNDYVVYHVGRSTVPGELDLCRHERAYSPFEVIEACVVRKRRDGEPSASLTRPSARALAQAVQFDAKLLDAYENRATI